MIRLNSQLQEIFQRDIPIVALYRYTTIDSFSHYLGQGNGEGEPTPSGTRSQTRIARLEKGIADRNKRHELRTRKRK